jgi:hypothetical protein
MKLRAVPMANGIQKVGSMVCCFLLRMKSLSLKAPDSPAQMARIARKLERAIA